MKRLIDFVLSAGGLVATAPILVVLILMIRRDSPGPGIFRQERVGRHGVIFICYKLRTMGMNAPNVPTHMAQSVQVTKIGAWLRRTKLDEIPQLWNVVRGDMSLVGPRPCLPSQVELVEERSKRGVLELRPGITGLAQVNGIDMSDPVRLAEKDAQYLKTQTLMLDMRLLVQTVRGKGQGDKIG